jgi:hypothetical protein
MQFQNLNRFIHQMTQTLNLSMSHLLTVIDFCKSKNPKAALLRLLINEMHFVEIGFQFYFFRRFNIRFLKIENGGFLLFRISSSLS